MEHNYISECKNTYFYINDICKTYGVCVSIKDSTNKDEIIKELLDKNKRRIECWLNKWKEIKKKES